MLIDMFGEFLRINPILTFLAGMMVGAALYRALRAIALG